MPRLVFDEFSEAPVLVIEIRKRANSVTRSHTRQGDMRTGVVLPHGTSYVV